MKRIGVISDTHGGLAALRLCAETAGNVDCWFHLGDFASDAEELRALTDKPVYSVRGNCDYGRNKIPTELAVEFGGKRFLLIHGHEHGLDRGNPLQAVSRAEDLKCDALLFGHTHQAMTDNYGGLLIVNPGSTRFPRGGKPSFAVLTIDESGKLKAEIIPIRHILF